MITLNANQANQTVLLSLREMRQVLTETFTHYLLVITQDDNGQSGVQLAQVPTIAYENDRITSLTVTTVTLTQGGTYRYEIYGQNSASNIDPENAAVVGSVAIGTIKMNDTTQYFNAPSIDIPLDVNG
jgi:hypothetical protein